jgi:cytochrome c553
MVSWKRVLLPWAVVMSAAAGCFVPPDDFNAEPSGGGAGSQEASGGSSSGGGQASGLPCEIDALLATHCQSCHGSPPAAPMPLLTYEDLAASAVSDPTRTVADLALERMGSTAAPMPPGNGPTVPAAEIEAFGAWVAAGLPKGDCGGSGGADGGGGEPVATVCSSEDFWVLGEDNVVPGAGELDDDGPWMNPGMACISCHEQEDDDGPLVLLGGTVYPTLHEPDLCFGVNGAESDAHVIVTDAQQKTFTMQLQRTGNFSLPVGAGPVVFPITAKVVSNGKERAMGTPQMSGDCNGCHTEQGKNGAPGRIFLP